MQKLLNGVLAGVALAALSVGSANAASVLVDGYKLEEGQFGAATGVHSNSSQTGSTVNAYVNQDGSAVTYSTNTGTLKLNGSGEATVDGDPLIEDLTVTFAKAWKKVTFNLDAVNGSNSDFTLLVNGLALFSATPNVGDDACTFCLLGNGQNKYIVSGAGITSLVFNFDPAIEGGKQFRVAELGVVTDPRGGVPEPATWAMMLIGFGALGTVVRSQRRRGNIAIRA